MSAFTTMSVGSIFFYVFAFALLVQLWYYLFFFKRLAFYKKKELNKSFPPASIIICVRNEEDNLVKFLHFIFEQDYPDFEVVVVNYCSFDNTADILKELAKKYSNLKIVTIQESTSHSNGKKVALMMGIKGAKNEHLLFTEADCQPNSKYWLKNMVQHFTSETEIVLGYAAYEKQKGILNKIIRFDAFTNALQYLSFALAGKAYMGTGRNLAYKRSLFFKMKGFASHYHIESGDDDLFVNQAATANNAKIEIEIGSHTVSRVKKTFKEWVLKKVGEEKTFKHYNSKRKFQIRFLHLSQYLFYATFITLLILQFEPIFVLSFFTLRLSIQIIIFNKSMRLLCEKDLLLFLPMIEFILIILYPLILLVNLFTKKNKWEKTNG